MSPAELDRIVAAIGDEILARMGRREPLSREGLDIPGEVCPGCVERCVRACRQKTEQIIAAGADRVSAGARVGRVDAALARMIDHTLLRPETTASEIDQVCQEALDYGFASVCINPYWVPRAATLLRGSPVKVCTVVGFPLGATTTETKRVEAAEAVRNGAQEVDMVINIGALRSGELERVKADIAGVVEVAHAGGAAVKVILETALLEDDQKVMGCVLAKMAKADFVKTSTGFAKHGATTKDVALMRLVVGDQMGVKAAGGIRSLDDLKKMAAAGATRIGASASVKIMEAAAAAPDAY